MTISCIDTGETEMYVQENIPGPDGDSLEFLRANGAQLSLFIAECSKPPP